MNKKTTTSKCPSSFFFKAGISKYNHLFEENADQHTAEDVYNMIRGFLTIAGYIIIKKCWLRNAEGDYNEGKNWFCVSLQSMKSSPAY